MLGFEHRLNHEPNLSGLHIGFVVENLDPKALERVKVKVLGVHDMKNSDVDYSVWAEHLAPSKQFSGEIPDIGDYVYIMFLGNDPMRPVWLGWSRVIYGW